MFFTTFSKKKKKICKSGRSTSTVLKVKKRRKQRDTLITFYSRSLLNLLNMKMILQGLSICIPAVLTKYLLAFKFTSRKQTSVKIRPNTILEIT